MDNLDFPQENGQQPYTFDDQLMKKKEAYVDFQRPLLGSNDDAKIMDLQPGARYQIYMSYYLYTYTYWNAKQYVKGDREGTLPVFQEIQIQSIYPMEQPDEDAEGQVGNHNGPCNSDGSCNDGHLCA